MSQIDASFDLVNCLVKLSIKIEKIHLELAMSLILSCLSLLSVSNSLSFNLYLFHRSGQPSAALAPCFFFYSQVIIRWFLLSSLKIDSIVKIFWLNSMLYAISISIEGEDLNLKNPNAHGIYMRVKSNAWMPNQSINRLSIEWD